MGLMTIGAIQSSYQAKEGEENPDFTCLRDCRDLLSEALGGHKLQLSMGMSNDFAAAIKAGSDNIRYASPFQLARYVLLIPHAPFPQSWQPTLRRTSIEGRGEEAARGTAVTVTSWTVNHSRHTSDQGQDNGDRSMCYRRRHIETRQATLAYRSEMPPPAIADISTASRQASIYIPSRKCKARAAS